ncbi:hypothetical protein LTR17_001560 [Elasticomyces elasticus]|nr:hypothetical protein LTR17_001560 [Elasticomyces elasticus]
MGTVHEKINPTGLNIIYEPEPGKAQADIVFVHGLQGHPYNTWACPKPIASNASSQAASRSPSPNPNSQKTKQKKSRWYLGRDHDTLQPMEDSKTPREMVFWPVDVLAKQCSEVGGCGEVRILSWGYDTVVTKAYKPTTKNNIFAHAGNLLAALEREQVAGRPLVFVAHSLGGIIVKEVLRRSDDSTEDSVKAILESTAAIVFMGTPHRGSDALANLANDVRRAASILLRTDSNAEIITALVEDGLELELGRKSFRKLWNLHKFHVKTFQEAKPITGLNIGLMNALVVPPSSSSLDDDRERAETIDADHITMSKFYGPDDPSYRQVGGDLKKIIQKIRVENTKRQELAALEVQRCLRNLSFPEMELRQSRIPVSSASTSNWVFENRKVNDWRLRKQSDTHHGLLWIKGKPGAGKSVLLKAMFRRVKESVIDTSLTPHIAVAHYFNRRGQVLEQNVEGMYRSLWHQILLQDEPLRKRFVQIYRSKKDVNNSVHWPPDELRDELLASIMKRDALKYDFFIDGIDECTDESNVISFAHNLTEKAVKYNVTINICLSGRHFPKGSDEKYLEIIMEDENWNAIRKYAFEELSKDSFVTRTSRTSLAETVANKSKGVFLWADFAVRTIKDDSRRGRSISATEARLNQLPTELHDLFRECFADFDPRDLQEALTIWYWVLFAREPLNLSMLLKVFLQSCQSHHLNDKQLNTAQQRTKYENFLRRILNLSKGLLEVIVEVPVPPPTKTEDVGSDVVREQANSEDYDPRVKQGSESMDLERAFIDKSLHQGGNDGNTECERSSTLFEASGDGERGDGSVLIASSSVKICQPELRRGITPGDIDPSYSAKVDVSVDSSAGLWSTLGDVFFSGICDVFEAFEGLDSAMDSVSYYDYIHIWDFQHPSGENSGLSVKQMSKAKVQFIHDTVREFFILKIAELSGCTEFSVPGHGHYCIATTCWSHLHRTSTRERVARAKLKAQTSGRAERYAALTAYSLKHFLSHCREAESFLPNLAFFEECPSVEVILACETTQGWNGSMIWHKVESGDRSILSFLLRNSLDRTAVHRMSTHPQEMRLADNKRNTFLHQLMATKTTMSWKELSSVIDSAVRCGVAINAKNTDLRTPLFVAAADRGHPDAKKTSLLLDMGADAGIRDRFGRLPLEMLTLFKRDEELSDLLTHHRALLLATGLTAVVSSPHCTRQVAEYAFVSFSDAELEHFFRTNVSGTMRQKRALSVKTICLDSQRPHYICLLAGISSFVDDLTNSDLKALIQLLEHDVAYPRSVDWTARMIAVVKALRSKLRRRRLTRFGIWVSALPSIIIPLLWTLLSVAGCFRLAPEATAVSTVISMVAYSVLGAEGREMMRFACCFVTYISVGLTRIAFVSVIRKTWPMTTVFVLMVTYGVIMCGFDLVLSGQCAALASLLILMPLARVSKKRHVLLGIVVEICVMEYYGVGSSLRAAILSGDTTGMFHDAKDLLLQSGNIVRELVEVFCEMEVQWWHSAMPNLARKVTGGV